MIMIMEALSTSETSVNIYQTTRRNIPQHIHIHTRRRENLKSHHIPVTLGSQEELTELAPVLEPMTFHVSSDELSPTAWQLRYQRCEYVCVCVCVCVWLIHINRFESVCEREN
jgi:hypothetical protein